MARRSLVRILIWVAPIAFLAHAPISEAATNLEVTVLGGAGDSPGMDDGATYFETVSTTTESSLSFGESANSPDGSSISSGSVGFGWARSVASASHSALNEGVTRTSSASAQALFRDDLTITAPGASGGGSVTFLIDVSGGLVATSSGETAGHSADADWSAFARASTVPAEAGRIAEGSLTDGQSGLFPTGDLMGGVYEWGPIPFGFGNPFEITIALNAEVDVNFCCSAAANFDSTLGWEGVVEIRDDGGALVSDFDITSSSGANYAEPIPVPEPSAEAMTLVSLLTMALLLRVRRSTQWRCAFRHPTS